MIDLHLHTTASDGRHSPASLVALASRRGVRILSVTDHDTIAGLAEARHAAAPLDVRIVPGIEVTAVEEARDVHVLGYFFDPANEALERFLRTQRAARVERVREIAERLHAMDMPIDVEAIIRTASSANGRSIGRPAIADALIAAGHVADRREAFDRFLAADRPAFVRRCGPGVAEVVDAIRAAGGIASLAHPGLLDLDAEIPRFAEAGLAAIEVRHRDHPAEVEARYRTLAASLGLAMSGGSDFHGEAATDAPGGEPLAAGPGSTSLSEDEFAELEDRARVEARRHASMYGRA